jgi:hypothetical protein
VSNFLTKVDANDRTYAVTGWLDPTDEEKNLNRTRCRFGWTGLPTNDDRGPGNRPGPAARWSEPVRKAAASRLPQYWIAGMRTRR